MEAYKTGLDTQVLFGLILLLLLLLLFLVFSQKLLLLSCVLSLPIFIAAVLSMAMACIDFKVFLVNFTQIERGMKSSDCYALANDQVT